MGQLILEYPDSKAADLASFVAAEWPGRTTETVKDWAEQNIEAELEVRFKKFWRESQAVDEIGFGAE